MTKRAAPVEMSGAEADHVGIIELRHFDSARVLRHGMSHAEIEELLDERPMTLACGDVTQA